MIGRDPPVKTKAWGLQIANGDLNFLHVGNATWIKIIRDRKGLERENSSTANASVNDSTKALVA